MSLDCIFKFSDLSFTCSDFKREENPTQAAISADLMQGSNFICMTGVVFLGEGIEVDPQTTSNHA